jgi:large subunit ribosomal protein L29
MQAKELVELAADELRVRERELREELLRLRLRRGTGQSDSPMKMRRARKNLARVLTVLNQKEKGTVRS